MLETLGAGVLLGLSAGFTPGPLLALVVAQSLRHGFREGAKVAFSPLLTDAPVILLCALVLSGLRRHDLLLGVVSLCGAAFVARLAWESLRAGPPEAAAEGGDPRSLLKGAVTNLLNPHPYLFWLTVGVPAILRGWAESPAAGTAFLAGFFGCLVGAKLTVARLACSSRTFLAGRGYVLLLRGLGMLLLGFAVLLLRDGLGLLGLLPAFSS